MMRSLTILCSGTLSTTVHFLLYIFYNCTFSTTVHFLQLYIFYNCTLSTVHFVSYIFYCTFSTVHLTPYTVQHSVNKTSPLHTTQLLSPLPSYYLLIPTMGYSGSKSVVKLSRLITWSLVQAAAANIKYTKHELESCIYQRSCVFNIGQTFGTVLWMKSPAWFTGLVLLVPVTKSRLCRLLKPNSLAS